MVYLATQKLEMTFDMTKVPSENVRESVLAWFSTMIGMQEDVVIGTGVLGITVALVMILIYVIRVRLKAKSNLHFAVKQFVEAELYAEQNPDCKEEMEKVDAHIQTQVEDEKISDESIVSLQKAKEKLYTVLKRC